MRLFIGINFDYATKEKISAVAQDLSTKGDNAKKGNLHLTLKFLGETESNRVESMKEAIHKASVKSLPFEISTSEVGSFSSKGEYTIWLGITKNKKLNELFITLENQLHQMGIEKEQRAFLPHITLQRRAKNAVSANLSPIKIAVDGITLFESVRTKEGLQYIPIYFAEFPNK